MKISRFTEVQIIKIFSGQKLGKNSEGDLPRIGNQPTNLLQLEEQIWRMGCSAESILYRIK